jgi:SAM-dependent methyltransferase
MGHGTLDVVEAGEDGGWTGALADHWAVNLHRHEAAYRHLTPKLIEATSIGEGDEVLDVGCGGGATTLQAANLAAGGHALGIDISHRLITIARARRCALTYRPPVLGWAAASQDAARGVGQQGRPRLISAR